MHTRKTSTVFASPLKTILLAGFVAGSLDLLAAIVILAKMNAGGVLKYIASAIYGKDAFAGGTSMMVTGLLIHFLIAFTFAVCYFLIYPKITFCKNYPVASGLLFGIIVWVIMNLVAVPLTNVNAAPFKWDKALLNMAILMVMIGLPISLITQQHYKHKIARRYF